MKRLIIVDLDSYRDIYGEDVVLGNFLNKKIKSEDDIMLAVSKADYNEVISNHLTLGFDYDYLYLKPSISILNKYHTFIGYAENEEVASSTISKLNNIDFHNQMKIDFKSENMSLTKYIRN